MRSPIVSTLIFSTAFLSLAQDTAGVGSISGAVLNSSGLPASSIRVCVLTTARCATTDDQGLFRLTEIRAGSYQLEVTSPELPKITSATLVVRAGL